MLSYSNKFYNDLTQACIDPIIISIQPTIVAADIPKNKPKLQPTSETKRFQKF